MDALCWLLYDEQDYLQNLDFAAHLKVEGQKRGLEVVPVVTSRLSLGIGPAGKPYARIPGDDRLPDAVLSRQRSSFISAHLEAMGIPVFNNAKVCLLCNDKRKTHQFLAGLPMLASSFSLPGQDLPLPLPGQYPLVVKPACSHGGDRVFLVHHEEEWKQAVLRIAPQPLLCQQAASHPGLDLRVYVVFGHIIAAVLRRAEDGFLSNYKKGGHVTLHSLTPEEKALAESVMERFEKAGAPLAFAGIDFLYHEDGPVLSEVEDVVGSRMLYQVSDIDIAGLFLDGVRERVTARR
ncbi:MAG: hypothetical protein GXY67_10735 [Clostridiales bacterium]|nr:hypothetical protein [Clostridiales bacterium]